MRRLENTARFGFQPLISLPQPSVSLVQKPRWFPGAKQPHVCIAVALRLAPSICTVCVCISLLLFTFSFVENPENHSETPATPAPPPAALPKPKPKPKPKKTPVPPKGAAAGASPKGDEVPPIKKNTKAPGKQVPVPPPKPASRNATREAGEYALCGAESRVLGSGVGSLLLLRIIVFLVSGVFGCNTGGFSCNTENALESPSLLSLLSGSVHLIRFRVNRCLSS